MGRIKVQPDRPQMPI